MSAGRVKAVIELDGDYLSAIEVSAGKAGLRVRRAVVTRRPAKVDAAQAEQVGAWIRQTLADSRIPTAGVVLALPRRDAVLKRLPLPQTMTASDPDLPGMVRLQVMRQSSVTGEGAVVDFVFIPASGGDPPSALAGVMGGERVAFLRAVADAADLDLRALTLRSFGPGPLIPREDGSTLAVTLGPGSVEFTLVEAGVVVFSRTAELARPDSTNDAESYAQKVGVEAKRTWMSYRLSAEGSRLRRIIVLGDDAVGRLAAERSAQALEAPCSALDPVVGAAWDESHASMHASELLGLVGLASIPREEMLDFAHPHEPPDRYAKARQLVLAAIFALIVLGGVGWFFAQSAISATRVRVEAAAAREKELTAQYTKMLMEKARLNHLKAWQASKPDWLAHVAWLSEHLPPPNESLLNTVSGSMDSSTSFVPGTGGDAVSGTWGEPPRLMLTIEGAGSIPNLVEAVRDRLIRAGGYVVRADGPDTGRGFSIDLLTSKLHPDRATPPDAREGATP